MREVPECVSGPVPGSPAEVLRCGELEKRSASLLQTWKRKRVVLSRESLSLFPPEEEGGGGPKGWKKGKALALASIAKVDCVERTGKYLYFTLVTTDRREIDFRCSSSTGPGPGPGSSLGGGGAGPGWNASIALALIDFQNRSALRRFRERQQHEGEPRDQRPRQPRGA